MPTARRISEPLLLRWPACCGGLPAAVACLLRWPALPAVDGPSTSGLSSGLMVQFGTQDKGNPAGYIFSCIRLACIWIASCCWKRDRLPAATGASASVRFLLLGGSPASGLLAATGALAAGWLPLVARRKRDRLPAAGVPACCYRRVCCCALPVATGAPAVVRCLLPEAGSLARIGAPAAGWLLVPAARLPASVWLVVILKFVVSKYNFITQDVSNTPAAHATSQDC